MSQTPDPEWALAVCEDPSLRTLSRVREAMGLPLAAVAELRDNLPGVCRRGPREEMERLRDRLEHHGLRASAFPAWQLDVSSEGESDSVPDEEYEVFTAVGHTDLLRFELPDITFSDLTDATMLEGRLEYPWRTEPSLRMSSDEMLDDYSRKNASPWRLRRRFTTRGGFRFLSERRRADLCGGGGVVSLSRVGLGRSGTLALVGFSYWGGPLCGFGCFLLFEKSGAGWEKTEQYNAWVS